VEHGVDIHAPTQFRGESLMARPLDDLGHREVRPVRMLSVKEGSRYPYLVGHLQVIPPSISRL
jgi:hypothetical protein